MMRDFRNRRAGLVVLLVFTAPSYLANAGLNSRCVASVVRTTAATGKDERFRERAPGDGFVVVDWPAESPQHLLLVRYHGHPGAQAAIVAGRMLHALEP